MGMGYENERKVPSLTQEPYIGSQNKKEEGIDIKRSCLLLC